jgi:hypothetical protein
MDDEQCFDENRNMGYGRVRKISFCSVYVRDEFRYTSNTNPEEQRKETEIFAFPKKS